MSCCFRPRTARDDSVHASYPVVSADWTSLPVIQLPAHLRHADLLTVSRTISNIDPVFVSQKLHLNGARVHMHTCYVPALARAADKQMSLCADTE